MQSKRTPSQSSCQGQCSNHHQELAVPTTNADYRCMVKTAGLAKRFWTALVIDSGHILRGIVNGTNYVGVIIFGNVAVRRSRSTHSPKIFRTRRFGRPHTGRSVYYRNSYHVAAANSVLEGSVASRKEMFCMCQGKTHACVLRILLALV